MHFLCCVGVSAAVVASPRVFAYLEGQYPAAFFLQGLKSMRRDLSSAP